MTTPKRYLTIVVNVALAFIASIIAYFTDWLILIPILFALGIPLINIDKPLKQKAGLMLLVVLISVLVFVLAVLLSLNIDYHNYVLQGLVVGIAGLLILLANGFLIQSVKITTKTMALTFLLAGSSFPLWILAESILPKTIANIAIIPEFGNMMFWMTLTTIGIASGIEDKKLVPSDRGNHEKVMFTSAQTPGSATD